MDPRRDRSRSPLRPRTPDSLTPLDGVRFGGVRAHRAVVSWYLYLGECIHDYVSRSSVFFLCLTIAVLALSGALLAQQPNSVSGTLTNSLSHDAVANATVTLEELGRRPGPASTERSPFPKCRPAAITWSCGPMASRRKRSEIAVATAPLAVDVTIDPELHYSEVVSVSPEGRNQFESFQPTTVLGGPGTDKALQGTLGATLENEPGVATRSFGPGPARPVIRGLDGDRVLVLEDGQRMGDLSSQSGDHGVNVNPAAASRIEVVRGPATLLYGANAIGGLVNVITNEIPTAPVTSRTARVTFDAGSRGERGRRRRRRHRRQRQRWRCT